MAYLRVEHESLDTVGGQIHAAPQRSAVPPPPQVSAPAADPVSAQAAHVFATKIAAIGAGSQAAASITTAAGRLMRDTASAYADQDLANSGGLALGGGGAAAVTPPRMAPTPGVMVPHMPAPALGTPPRTGKDIATVVHGGPGEDGLHAAAARLDTHAAHLHDTAGALRAAVSTISGVWDSRASGAAQDFITDLAARYTAHGELTSTTADGIRAQAGNFHTLRHEVPKPREFEEIEQRLRTAYAANARSGGMYRAVIVDLERQLAEKNLQATTAYAGYGARSAPATALGNRPEDIPAGPDDVIVGGDEPNHIQLVDYPQAPPPNLPQDPAPPPPPPPAPPPPVTGEPIKLPPRTEPPPVQVIDANLPGTPPPPNMFPNCSTMDVWVINGQAVAGGLGVLGGAIATPFTFGGGLVPLLGGAAAFGDAVNEMRKCG